MALVVGPVAFPIRVPTLDCRRRTERGADIFWRKISSPDLVGHRLERVMAVAIHDSSCPPRCGTARAALRPTKPAPTITIRGRAHLPALAA
jgi:hypothetical protein